MPTVLVVEDEPMLRASMVRGLAKLSGVSVLSAGTVDEARAIIAAGVPQLVITDLNLPDRSGLEVISALDRLGARVPVVIASAYLKRFKVPERPGIVLCEKPVALSRLREIVVEHLGLDDLGAPFTLTDYLQLASMGRRSVRLEVLRDARDIGEVVVHRGEAWSARDAQGVGPAALARLLDAPDATVAAHAVTTEPPRNLQGPCESLLLDHFRRQDERRRDDPAELVLDALDEAPAGVSSLPAPVASPGSRPVPPRAPPPPPPRVPAPPPQAPAPSFDALYARGVEALLDRRYEAAFEAFEAASRVGSSPSLAANLARLRTLGFGR